MGRKKKGQDFLDLPEIGGDADGEHASDEAATAKALATAPTSGSKKKGKKGKNKGAAADWDSDNEPGLEASRSDHLPSTSAADGGGNEENGKHLGESAGSDAEDGMSPSADVSDEAVASRKAAKKKDRKSAASAFAALAMDDDDAEEEEEGDSAEPSNTLQALQDEEEAGSADAESGPALVAAEIIKVSKHPKKDTLRVCSVNTGGETVTVVTNVKDVRAGEVVVLAPVGATTPGSGMLVDARELKGVRSQGMFCSAYDIGWVDTPDNQLVRLPASFRAGNVCPKEQPGSPSTSGRQALGAFDRLQEEAEDEAPGEDAASAFAALLGEAAGDELEERSRLSDGKKGKKDKKAKKQPDSAAAAFALLADEPQDDDEEEQEEEDAAEGGGAAAAFAALAVEADAEEPEEEGEVDRAAPSSKSRSKKSKKDKKKKRQEDETGGADMFALLGEVDELPEEQEEEEDGTGGAAAAAFAALVGKADEAAGEADAEPEEAEAASRKKGKKDKKKKKKLEKAAEDDDLDALLAEIDGPAAGIEEPAAAPEEESAAVAEEPVEAAEAAEPAETGKKGKKKKKGQAKKQDDEDLDALLAEFGAAPAATPAEEAPADDAAGAPEPEVEEPGEAADVAEGEEGGTKELTANQKKKLKKKQKEKEKRAATGAAEEDGGDAAAAAAAAGKKGGKKVSAAKLRLLQEIEARERREREVREAEEEALRLEEEERQREEEEERRKEEEKAKRKEAKRLAKEQAKKEGRLLTAKQKEDERRREAIRQQMLAQAAEKGVSFPDAMEADDKPKKKPIYDNKKRSAAKKREEEEARKRAEEEEARLAALEEERVRKQQQQQQEEQRRRQEETAAQAAAKAEAEVGDSWEDAVLDDWEAADEVELATTVVQADAKEEAKPSMEVVGAKTAAAAKLELDSAAAQDDDEAEEEEEEEEDGEESDEDEEDSDEEDDSSEEEEDSSDEEDSSEEESLDSDEIREEKLDALKEKLAGKLAKAKEAAHKDDLRSPICCILGHVDTGKTKILDNIRRTNVQEGEAGGITQQIGATYIPREAVENRTQELRNGRELNMKMPGLLVIDTPGHESFTNLRTRGSGLCDMAVLVVDIMHGLEQQTIESIGLLKMRKTPFVIALNKVDRLYQWKSKPNAAIRESLKRQNRQTMQEYEERLAATKLALNEQGLNVELYWKNPDPRKFVNLIPTSAITGEGIPDLMQLVVKLTQTMMAERLMYIEYMQCTVLEVKVIEGYGHTIDVVLVNGTLRQGDRVVLCGLDGPIVSTIRSLLTPQPLKELRVKNAYTKHPQVKAAQGIKISAQDLEKAVAGTQLYVIKKGDDEQAYRDLVMEDMKSIFESVDKSGEGVCVQASTLGSLEALLEFLKSDAVKIPVSGINIGPVHKKDVMRANVMMEKGQRKFACILAFDVPVTRDAEDLARNLGIRVFTADIIYHLFDQFSAYVNEVRAQELQVARRDAVFPCVLEIVPNCVFNAKDPIVLGVNVVEGQAHVGTPLCVPSRDGIMIGRIASMEKDHRPVDVCKVGDSCAMKIEGQNAEEQSRLVGRHFTEQDQLVSRVSRASINILKQHFREEMAKDDWRLVVRLKSVFKIDGPGG